MQLLLSVAQAKGDLRFGQRASSDAADGIGESGHGIGRLVGIAEAVLGLDFVFRVGRADGVNYGSPSQFAGNNVLAAVGKLLGQCRQVAGFAQVRQRIQTDGSLRWAVSSSTTSHRMAGR